MFDSILAIIKNNKLSEYERDLAFEVVTNGIYDSNVLTGQISIWER